ncbi:MAG: PLP-dependent cysteine synthase family protein [Rhizobiales bacterium]|nr:PLP-dependent cysteine synthase family protein [Hyphomicrobiales bacterium]
MLDHLDADFRPPETRWTREALAKIAADYNRSADTHLIRLDLPCLTGIDLYLKDESTHPSGSLKHRLARSLFLYGLCNGWIREGRPVIEASSGSTAISEAYFARLIGVPFIAVVPAGTAPEKLRQIEFYGGRCHPVAPGDLYGEAERLARDLGGHYVDQFTYAERATDWRGNNNIAESIFAQMEKERHAIPSWIVVSAGTGGGASTIGRYIRYRTDLCGRTRLCVVDPENSVFYDAWKTGDRSLRISASSRIEGIGRPRCEPSFMPDVIDAMIKAPDAASLAAIRWLETVLGRKCGGSTGTNLVGAAALAADMIEKGETGSIVTLICDPGERYLQSYYDDRWIAERGYDLKPWIARFEAFAQKGCW